MPTLEVFAPLVGQTFTLHDDSVGALPAALLEARGLSSKAINGRIPFSLMFEGPPEPVLPQRVYRLEHPNMAALDLFIVPVGQSPAGTRYEAIFS